MDEHRDDAPAEDPDQGGEGEETKEPDGDPTDDRPWSGWGSLSEIQDAVSGLVDSALKTVGPTTGRFPRYDLIELPEDGYLILFDLPGLEKSDVEVSAHGGEVTIEGTRARPDLPDGSTVERSERTYGRFRRAVEVPPDVDLSGIRAKMINGVLEVRLPRQAPHNAQKIRVD